MTDLNEKTDDRIINDFSSAIHFITWDTRHKNITPEEAQEAIKQAVDKYVIGEVQELPKRGDVDPDIYVEVIHRVEGRNALRAEQRRIIAGKEKTE